MSHRIYQTDAYIFQNQPQREADLYLTLFTRELGLIRGVAQGARYEKSKLRFSLQDFSLSSVSLVQGKSGWRVTNAFLYENLHHTFRHDQKHIFLWIIRVFRLLERLLQGEEANPELFDLIKNAQMYAGEHALTDRETLDLECVLTLQILHNLGYIGDTEGITFYTTAPSLDHSLIKQMNQDRDQALQEISRALKQSHL